MSKIKIDNSNYIEFASEMAGSMTELKFGNKTYKDNTSDCLEYTDEAQDFFDEKYDEVQEQMESILGIVSDII